MFGFLKDKLKSWLGKSKEKVETKAKLAEPKKEKEKEKKKTGVKEKPVKKEKIKKSKAEIQEERKITEHVIKDIKEENLELKTPEEKFEEKQEELEKEEQKQKETEKKGFFAKLKGFFAYKITESDFLELFEDLEMLLLENNVAFGVVDILKNKLKLELVGKEIKKGQVAEEIQKSLKSSIESILLEPENPIEQIKKFRKESKEF